METILNTIFCRNGVIPSFSAWAGIVGLMITVWTLCTVRSVRTTLDNFRAKRLLQVRLPEQIEFLQEISERVSDVAYPSDKRKKIDVPVMISSLETTAKICESIKKLDVARSISLQNLNALENTCKQLSASLHQIQDRKVLQDKLQALCPCFFALIGEVEEFRQNMKAEVDNGLR